MKDDSEFLILSWIIMNLLSVPEKEKERSEGVTGIS